MKRISDIYRPVEVRKHDFCEVERMLTAEEAQAQTERCQNCGIPFCHGVGCPLGNLVPDQNRAVFAGDGTKETIAADLVLLAMGFTGVPKENPIVSQLRLLQTPRTALVTAPSRNIYCVGDCASGASLVVRAIASGKNIPLQ